VDSQLRDELTRDEGCRLSAYQDTRGFWTIGVGHLLGNAARMTSITPYEALSLLAGDVDAAQKAIEELFPDWSPCDCTHVMCEGDRVRNRALINMVFNRGIGAMQTSTSITPAIRQAMKDKNWAPVTVAIAGSEWARQVGARATRLAYMLEHGEVMP
jgi:lysozyme